MHHDESLPATAARRERRRFRLTPEDAKKLAWGMIIGGCVSLLVIAPVIATMLMGGHGGHAVILFILAGVAVVIFLAVGHVLAAVSFAAAFLPINPWLRLLIGSALSGAVSFVCSGARHWWIFAATAVVAAFSGALAMDQVRRDRYYRAKEAAEAAAHAPGYSVPSSQR